MAQRLQRARVDQSEFCPSRHRTACHSAYAVPMDRHREPDVRMKIHQAPYGEPSRQLRDDRSLQQDEKRHLWQLAAGSVLLSAGAKTCKSGALSPSRDRTFTAVQDGTLIRATAWSWGAYVDGLEAG